MRHKQQERKKKIVEDVNLQKIEMVLLCYLCAYSRNKSDLHWHRHTVAQENWEYKEARNNNNKNNDYVETTVIILHETAPIETRSKKKRTC